MHLASRQQHCWVPLMQVGGLMHSISARMQMQRLPSVLEVLQQICSTSRQQMMHLVAVPQHLPASQYKLVI